MLLLLLLCCRTRNFDAVQRRVLEWPPPSYENVTVDFAAAAAALPNVGFRVFFFLVFFPRNTDGDRCARAHTPTVIVGSRDKSAVYTETPRRPSRLTAVAPHQLCGSRYTFLIRLIISYCSTDSNFGWRWGAGEGRGRPPKFPTNRQTNNTKKLSSTGIHSWIRHDRIYHHTETSFSSSSSSSLLLLFLLSLLLSGCKCFRWATRY